MTTTRCHRCGRTLTDPNSVKRGYGPGCARKLKAAAQLLDVTAYSQTQLDKAAEAIETFAVVPSTTPGVWLVVGSHGDTYATDPIGARCTCPAGQHSRLCYHVAAAAICAAA